MKKKKIGANYSSAKSLKNVTFNSSNSDNGMIIETGVGVSSDNVFMNKFADMKLIMSNLPFAFLRIVNSPEIPQTTNLINRKVSARYSTEIK
jgi:hypothetical protein